MARLTVSAYLIAVCSWMNTAFSAGLIQFTGKAYDIETQELLYTEHHEIYLNTLGAYEKGEVTYRHAEGHEIATKTLDFSLSSFVPNLVFIDHRSDTVLNLSYQHGEALIERSSDEKRDRNHVKTAKRPLVADAGFDRYIVENWETLKSGTTLSFDMLALDRGEQFGFQIERVAEEGDQVTFEIKPESWLIRLLMKPILLRYSSQSKHLQEYVGLTNIEREKGIGNYQATIVYEY